MMKKVLAAVFCFALAGFAQDANDSRKVLLNTVSVGADGKFETAPDTAVLQFTVAAQEGNSDAAYDKAAKAAERMRQALRSNGLDPKSAEIGYYSLQPVYDYRSPKRSIVGYRVTSNVTLKIKDFSKIGSLVQSLSGIEESENQNISYILENTEAAKQKAIDDAFNRARASASTIAKAGGRTLGDLAYASVDTAEQQPPMPMMRAMSAGSAGKLAPTEEFSPQKVTVTAHVNALFMLK